jgi:hypothetical protein
MRKEEEVIVQKHKREEVECTGCGVMFVPKRKRRDGETNFHNDDCRVEYVKRKRKAERRILR